MTEVRFPEKKVAARSFEHPDGSTGVLALLTVDDLQLADAFDLEGDFEATTTMIPLRHNTDGRTDFEEYRHEDGDIVFEMTDQQFAELQSFITEAL